MKLKNIFSAALLATVGMVGFNSCDTEVENETIQHLYKYDAQYFENLRAWKKTPHEISYVYYAAWAPLEGQDGYKDPASWGERFVGLPDSLDIVNLWIFVHVRRSGLQQPAPRQAVAFVYPRNLHQQRMARSVVRD